MEYDKEDRMVPNITSHSRCQHLPDIFQTKANYYR